MRYKTIYIFTIIVFLLILAALLFTQIFKGGYYKKLAKNNCMRLITWQGRRGSILDRNNSPLAQDLTSFDILTVSSRLSAKTLNFLEGLLSINSEDSGEINKKNSVNSFYPLDSKYLSSFMPVVIAHDISRDQAMLFQEYQQEYPEVFMQIDYSRFYPRGNLAAHIIGYLSQINRSKITRLKDYGYKISDIVGYSGAEEEFDRILRAEDGGWQVLVDHKARQAGILGFKSPINGADINLTLDLHMQSIVEEELSGRRGCVVIINPHTGEILSLASSPSFNPNIFMDKDNTYTINQLLKDPNKVFLNRSIAGQYPAGSIFKLIIATAALDSGKSDENLTFVCNKDFRIGGKIFSCSGQHLQENLLDAIAHSCNIYFYNLGIKLGPNLISEYAAHFGLGKLTGVDIPYETAGFLPTVAWKKLVQMQNWYAGDTANLSIGQGELLVTPLQATRMISVFANGGKLIKPYILKSIGGKATGPVASIDLNLKNNTIAIVREGLKRVVEDQEGSAHVLSMNDLSVAGKTGTAQAGIGKNSHAWFIGFCPFQQPKLAFCVFLENGGSSANACIITRRILERFIKEGIL